jgi:hypothetical protein
MDTDNKNDITSTEKDTMHDAGVDLPINNNTQQVKEETEEFVDIDSGASASMNDLTDMGINFVKENVVDTDKDVMESKKMDTSMPGGKDLENEFKSTIGGSSSAAEKDSFGDKISSLQLLLGKIKEKLGFKKAEVKEEIENLKKAKEEIAKDIENIKELEESEQKIQEELKKVESIKEKITDIEKEVEKELSS